MDPPALSTDINRIDSNVPSRKMWRFRSDCTYTLQRKIVSVRYRLVQKSSNPHLPGL